MRNNIWIHNNIAEVFFQAVKRKRIDKIPATVGGEEGVLIVSQSDSYANEMLEVIRSGADITRYGDKTALIKGTEIEVDVSTIRGASK